MDPQRWARIESLYHAVLNQGPSERSRYLAGACAGDSDLRHEVETLLGYADAELKSPTADAFLSDLRLKDPELHDQVQHLLRAREDTVTIPAGANVSQLNRNPGVNDLVGPYRLLRVLGEGGMCWESWAGVIYPPFIRLTGTLADSLRGCNGVAKLLKRLILTWHLLKSVARCRAIWDTFRFVTAVQ